MVDSPALEVGACLVLVPQEQVDLLPWAGWPFQTALHP